MNSPCPSWVLRFRPSVYWFDPVSQSAWGLEWSSLSLDLIDHPIINYYYSTLNFLIRDPDSSSFYFMILPVSCNLLARSSSSYTIFYSRFYSSYAFYFILPSTNWIYANAYLKLLSRSSSFYLYSDYILYRKSISLYFRTILNLLSSLLFHVSNSHITLCSREFISIISFFFSGSSGNSCNPGITWSVNYWFMNWNPFNIILYTI